METDVNGLLNPSLDNYDPDEEIMPDWTIGGAAYGETNSKVAVEGTGYA
jgi:hypothetical protein